MKKLLFLAAALSAACAASAQGYYTDAYNPDITRHTGRIAAQRAEFILPEVNGYNVYMKAGVAVGVIWQDGRPFHRPYAIRLNLALPHVLVKEAFDRMDKYVFNAK